MEPGPAPRLLALLGDPVAHSLSPRFQNAAIRAAGVDAVYLPLRCDADHFEGLFRGIAAAGGAGNVTLPHKTRAAALLDAPTKAVQRTGACNTFWPVDGRIHGDNTDVEGFARAARRLIGSPAGARVLVLGAGGAARAVVLALMDERADAIHLLNRTPGRARAVAETLDPRGRKVLVVEGGARGVEREGYDLVVNATSLGLAGDDPLPLALDLPARVGAVLDLVYREDGTPWVAAARDRDIPAADGLEMLVEQGAASFRRWFDREPDVGVMREAVGA
jgi:shikimate dehydrogenase